jgi:hypothetical protein
LGDPLKGNLLLFYKPLHLEAQQVSTRIEVRRHQQARTKVKTRGASCGNSDVRAETMGKECRENLVEEPKGMPSIHPEGGEGAVMDGGAGNGLVYGKTV